MADTTQRIDAREAHDHLAAGDALLVCAYEEDEKYWRNHLDGALSLADFRARADSIPKDSEIIFYCA